MQTWTALAIFLTKGSTSAIVLLFAKLSERFGKLYLQNSTHNRVSNGFKMSIADQTVKAFALLSRRLRHAKGILKITNKLATPSKIC